MFTFMPRPLPKFQFTHQLPYGAVVHDHGVQFAIFSRHASEMRLLLYQSVEDTDPTEIITFARWHLSA